MSIIENKCEITKSLVFQSLGSSGFFLFLFIPVKFQHRADKFNPAILLRDFILILLSDIEI